MPRLSVVALVVAAGRGTRAGADLPKQFLRLGPRSVLSQALQAFTNHPMIDRVEIVVHADDTGYVRAAISETSNPRNVPITTCHGGETRQDSVARGLKALSEAKVPGDAIVLIHDAARPFVSEALTTRAIAAADRTGAAIPVQRIVDTLIRHSDDNIMAEPIDRAALRSVQTPQSFRFGLIHAAHLAVARDSQTGFTDDAGIARWAGHVVHTFEGDDLAFKLTTPADVDRARQMVGANLNDIRSATGYDVHAFGPGDQIMLGGVSLPHDRGVVGHSDADVLLHALTDALLGCIADGDVGSHFPPSDMRWKGAESHIFLAEAVRRVHALGGVIRHLDSTVVAESPRIGPHRDAIRARIADIVGIDRSRISLKATTSERLGFTGRREGIAALATATIALPAKG